jgi:serine protease AprX
MSDERRTHPSRRTILKGVGAAGAAALPFSATVASGATVDDALDTSSDDLQEVLVVFEDNADVDRLRHLALEAGYHKFEMLPIGYTKLTGSQIETVADWPEARFVEANREIDYHNDDARATTGAETVQSDLGYTGESVHAAVIDTGVDGDHPDLADDLVAHYRFVNPLTNDGPWIEAGSADTDDNGHGTHTSGSVTASGKQSDGQFRGMAPDADLTVYSMGATLFIVNAALAFDHLVARKRAGETDVQAVSNSYGSASADDFDPDLSINVASWHAFQADILPLFSAGNSGEACETPAEENCWTAYNTLNDYAKAPYVLGVGATRDDKHVTEFSSRGRRPSYDGTTNYDRKTALSNFRLAREPPRSDNVVDEGSRSGTVGPTGTGSEYEEWQAPSNAGFVEAELSWTPENEDVDLYLHEESRDGEVVASGATLQNPETLSGVVEGDSTYYFEIRPFANVSADYTLSFTAYQGSSRDVGPIGLYRVGVAAPGNRVMSTMAPSDPLQGVNPDDRPYYARISGTSMSCPVTAGAAVLTIDAYQQNNDGTPASIDVLNTVETTAEDVHEEYAPWNAGAGFVDVLDAVERAETGTWGTFGSVDLTDY